MRRCAHPVAYRCDRKQKNPDDLHAIMATVPAHDVPLDTTCFIYPTKPDTFIDIMLTEAGQFLLRELREDEQL